MQPDQELLVDQPQPTEPAPGSDPPHPEHHSVEWILVGPRGLRAGWSILLFAALYYLFRIIIGTVFFAAGLVDDSGDVSAGIVLVSELIPLFAMLGAAVFMSFVSGQRVLSYNLTGSRRFSNLLFGILAGFAALSLLIAALAWGGWLQFGPAVLSEGQALRESILWGCAFLAVGAVEEGLFRCYGLFTLTRGINFWWALVAQTTVCLYVAQTGGHGIWGVYVAAAIGLFPCLILHRKAARRKSAFWQAAWVTSTVFGLYHTSNSSESSIGIFAAAFMGFAFCVSVYVTGSAWWAIGCHAAWDWAETFFYGTADSGLEAQGHFFTSNPAGNPLWSGGSVGPEGSLLVVGIILLLLILLFIYRRGNVASLASVADHTAH